MNYFEVEIPEKTGYVIPISDLHIGDQGFSAKSERKVRGYIDWVLERPNARIILNGDIFNTATRSSKTAPFSSETDKEIVRATKIFEPVKDKIITAIEGNHEARLLDFASLSLTKILCQYLSIPYGGFSCVINFKVWKRTRGTKGGLWGQQYQCYTHHTTGGGGTVGGKINRVAKLVSIVPNCDFYLGSHNHQLGVIPVVANTINVRRKRIDQKVQHLVDTGGYLDWQGYPEQKMLQPTKIGSPRIRLSGMKRDVHVSI